MRRLNTGLKNRRENMLLDFLNNLIIALQIIGIGDD